MKYYKFRNANSSFEHGVIEQLSKIVKNQEEKNENLICGVFSAIIANYFTVKVNDVNNVNVIFVVLLVFIYALLLFVIRMGRYLVHYLCEYGKRDTVSDNEEKIKRDVFFNKVINEVIRGISLVNRIEILKIKNKKQELCYIYAVQALYCFQKTAEYLDNIIFRKTKKHTRKAIECIGVDSIEWVLNYSMNYLDKINKIYDKIDVDIAKEYYTRRIKELKEYRASDK